MTFSIHIRIIRFAPTKYHIGSSLLRTSVCVLKLWNPKYYDWAFLQTILEEEKSEEPLLHELSLILCTHKCSFISICNIDRGHKSIPTLTLCSVGKMIPKRKSMGNWKLKLNITYREANWGKWQNYTGARITNKETHSWYLAKETERTP